MADRKIRQADGLLMEIHDPSKGPVLPKKGQRNILITSALPYVNNVPHLGNIIGSTLSADVFARYNRTRNLRTLYICGTDEYGTATETKALEEGVSPMELTTKFHGLHTEVYKWFDIGFDEWGRTSTPEHTEIVQDIYKHIHKNDFIELQTADQTYCEDDKLFLADRFVEGVCPNCGYDDARGDQCDKCSLTFSSPTELLHPRCKRNKNHKVSVRPSTHACFSMNKVQKDLEEWMQKTRIKGKWAGNVVINDKGEIVEPRMLGDGLRPSPVTRDLKWGVQVPKVGNPDEDKQLEDKVIYVWFDACIGYISITSTYTDKWRDWWFDPDDVELYQFMGKDNVYFHTVLFPSTLIADGRDWTKLHRISATQYLNYEDTKFSKSRNVGVFGNQAQEIGQPASVWRYYLISQRPETGDTAFQWSKFIAAINNELLANLGNFINRVIKFTNLKYASVVPGPADTKGGEVVPPANPTTEWEKIDAEFVKDVNARLVEFRESMDATKIRHALSVAMAVSARGNQYLQDSGLDNALLANHPERCAQVVLNAINLIYDLSVLFHPFIPSTSEDILKQLNAPARALPDYFSIDILPGHKVGQAAHLFKRIDNPEEQEAAWQKKYGGDAVVEAGNGDAKPVVKGAVNHDSNWAASSKKKKAAAEAAAAAQAAKSPEERELEAKVDAQNQVVKSIRTGKAQGDVEKETARAKQFKAELTELKKKLKEAKI
ncbi:methionine--tRNA ligase mes1 [Vanrija albida]|uniref:methionine--tRNA ligase n=1 Tax=Vanrija albida TaxID=181172 RepID=A0ABR3QEM0_9TREE